MDRVEMKIGKMRKPQSFIVHWTTVIGENGGHKEIIVQSNKSIGRLNVETGAFKFTNKGCYFPELEVFGVPTELPEEYKKEILKMAGVKEF